MFHLHITGTLPAGITKKAASILAERAWRRGVSALAFGGAGKMKRQSHGFITIGAAELSLTVVNDAKMRALNKEYRGKDKTTDVLSFGQLDARGVPVIQDATVGEPRQLGDIFVSLPQVRRQAREIGRPVEQEFALMVVHGTLHVLGFDHETLKQENRMFELQHDILAQAGYF